MASGRNVGIEELLGQRDWLRRLAWHLAGQESDGEDLAQDAWVAAQRSPPDPDRPARPWLAKVLRNLIHTRRRDERRRARRERAYQDSGPDRAAAVDDAYERLQLQRFVVERVMALDESLRTVVMLRYFEGLDSARIAQLTGAPAGTVRWRLKRAIEQLRGSLDERHGSNRAAWVAVLAPGAVGKPQTSGGAWVMASTRTKALLVSLTGIGLLAIASAVLWMQGGRNATGAGGSASAGAPAPNAGGQASRGAGAPPGTPPPKLMVDPGSVDPEQARARCLATLAEARDGAQALEREARALIPALAFDASAPNSQLRAQVVPQIERQWPAAAASQGISYAVECRGWACCLAVLFPPEKSPEVEPRLRTISIWMPVIGRLRDLQITPPSRAGVVTQRLGSRPTKDLAGKKLEEHTFCFGAQPDTWGGEEGSPPAAPLPESLQACRSELAAIEERIRPRLAQLPAFRPLTIRFRDGAADPKLTAKVQAAAERARADAQVECRSGICRLRFTQPPDGATLARLRHDRDLDERIAKEQPMDRDLYLTVAEPGWPSLARMRAPLRQAGFFAGCPQPERDGNVLLRLMVPETGIPNENGVFGQASVQLAGGTLATSAAARCLTERMAAVLSASPLPEPMRGLLRFESWTWRPGEPPRMVTPPSL